MSPQTNLDVTFLDHLQPRATAGTYRLATHQQLTKNGTALDTGDPLPTETDSFEVRAVRFILAESSIHAYYPPADSRGLYTRVLPHVTLDRAILPWERELDNRKRPWLALLLFREGELPDDPLALGLTVSRTVAELLEPAEHGVLGPVLTPDIPEAVKASPCRTIDVPASIFTAVVPHADELPFLAHVRDVKFPPQRRDDGEILQEGRYAVLTGNRFPRTQGTYVAHMVSLEGFQTALGSEDLPPHTTAVRLCSLSSWSFTSDATDIADTGQLLENLVAPGATDPEHLALRLTAPSTPDPDGSDAQDYALSRLGRGYVALPSRLPTGELTYAWYRGPGTPVTAPTVPTAETPHTTADHALIYEAEHGLFDVSYAAAWTLGRTIALADPDYTSEIVRARRELANRAATLTALSADADAPRAKYDPDAPTGHYAFDSLAKDNFGQNLTRALSAPQHDEPISPPPRRTQLTKSAAREALRDPDRRAALRHAVEGQLDTMPQWLDRLTLLHGVPFSFLVPDARMLPPETLRLFRIDPAWIAALLAGARSVGIHTTQDDMLDPILQQCFQSHSTQPAAGLLMSSELVRAWPVFDITATLKDTSVTELRRDHLSPTVLLCLFDAVPDLISIKEPAQGIHFGLDDHERIRVRGLDSGPSLGLPSGSTFPDAAGGTVFTRFLRPADDTTADVLHLQGNGGLVPALDTALGKTLSPSQFALQLVNAPLRQSLHVQPPTSTARS
ncbi:hypothetical protein ACIP5Y_07005 [Nocardia sp. NPDC088792]|uniref:hypothetical protein n=1 Tax=Nocardia sp. NPDC088792 TaxID=3364332 RepID=UPI0038103DD6